MNQKTRRDRWGRARGATAARRGHGKIDQRRVESYDCHRSGHIAQDCRVNTTNGDRRANYVHEDLDAHAEQGNLFMTSHVAEKPSEEVSYLHSNCSHHMIGKKELFSDVIENFKTKIILGNNKALDAAKGPMEVGTKEGMKKFITFTMLQIWKTC